MEPSVYQNEPDALSRTSVLEAIAIPDEFHELRVIDMPEERAGPDRSSLTLTDLLAELTKTVAFFGALVHDERQSLSLRVQVADRQLQAFDIYAKILGRFDLEQRIAQNEAAVSKMRRDFGGEP